MTSPRVHALLVAGVVSHDLLLYPPMTAGHGGHDELPDGQEGHANLTIRAGAAHLVAQLLTAASPRTGFEVLSPESHHAKSDPSHIASSLVDLGGAASTSSSESSHRVLHRRDIARPHVWHAPGVDKVSSNKSNTLVICGSGDAQHNVDSALQLFQKAQPRYIVHHMTRPLATGPLWDIIRRGPLDLHGQPVIDNLAVIIDADDLRAEGISLSRSLSWEKTAEDFVRNLGSNGRLDTLVTCPNLIVRFGNEAVIHHRGRDATNPRLYFNQKGVENDSQSESDMIGLSSAFTAGFALGFVESSTPDVEKAIRMGMSASSAMNEHGFVTTPQNPEPNYPIEATIAAMTKNADQASVAIIPSAQISSRDSDNWSIFDAVTGDPAEVARQIVLSGPERALARCPVQQFGDLISVDRIEQESLRSVVGAVSERLRSNVKQPTSIGIMGLPGSGKKFVATNLAAHFATMKTVKILNYNARLIRQEDLTALCHTIRDHTANGILTVVLFENFEAVMDSSNQLLNDFLVMMRDGLFTDRSHVHAIGQPLLFFMVNSGVLSGEVPPTPGIHTSRERQAFSEVDLLDYLHGVVRIAGPNQASLHDKIFSVRRALMLRKMLLKRFPHLSVNGAINVDDAVLHALLLVPRYTHGLRSLDKILSTSRLSSRSKFDISALPPEEQIQLHVDGKIFMSFLRSPKLPPALREKIAQGLFEAYKKKRKEIARTEKEKAELESDPSMYDWHELSNELKESTRSQADDIPRKLRAVNCFMLDQERGEPLIRVPEFTVTELDMLSEMEHERFNAERLQRQWKMGARASDKRTTPFIVPWRDLTQDWKDVDRVMVECVPRVLDRSGWKIYRMPSEQ